MFVAIRTYSHFHVVHLELVASLVVLYHVQASAPLLSPATSLSLFSYIEVKPLMHPRPKVHALFAWGIPSSRACCWKVKGHLTANFEIRHIEVTRNALLRGWQARFTGVHSVSVFYVCRHSLMIQNHLWWPYKMFLARDQFWQDKTEVWVLQAFSCSLTLHHHPVFDCLFHAESEGGGLGNQKL